MMKDDLSKEKIMQCADEIIESEGIRALSVSKIVNRLKISKTTFYKYFSSRDALIIELKDRSNSKEADLYTIRDKIIQQAIEEFSKNTFDKIDIDTIAAAVGLKRSSLYRYFSSKEELLEASLKYEISNRMKLKEYFDSRAYDLVDFLKKLFEYTIVFYNKKYNSLMFYNALYYSKSNDKIKSILEDLWNQTIKLNEEVFERGKREGILKEEIESKVLARMVLSYIGGTAIFSYEEFDRLENQFIDMLLRDIMK